MTATAPTIPIHLPAPTIAVKRRTIDAVLIGVGLIVAVVLATSGGLLTWGSNFSNDYVGDELSSQNITFPTAEALTTDGRIDLLDFAGEQLTTGSGAQAYASYINGHLEKIADGATYADLGPPERAARTAVQTAKDAGESQPAIDALQATATGLTEQRNTLFKGETLRGLLLSAYAWSTVGRIAGIAAIGAFIAAALMLVLVALGIVHHRRLVSS
jgi:hypothetical protein